MRGRILLSALAILPVYASAQAISDYDTTYMAQQEMRDVVVTSIKVNKTLQAQPLASSTLQMTDSKKGELTTMRDVSAVVPNFYMPDYGSSLTSAIYIRGIGSRINTPAVGLYVDDIPYIDKSAFSFDFIDIERIEVLRGPQGTLYGRNAMGGLLNITSISPFRQQGTTLRVSTDVQQSKGSLFLSHRHHCTERMAFVAEGFFSRGEGFYKYTNTDETVDDFIRYGGRVRATFIPHNEFKVDLTLNYEHTQEGGYAYEYLGVTQGEETSPECVGKISSNRNAGYWRSLFNGGLKALHQMEDMVLTSVTGFQLLNDCMTLDQDFLPSDTFELDQHQRLRTITEEVVLKRRDKNASWQWTSGLFGYYQWLTTNSPVRFNEAGVQMIQQFMDKAMTEAQAPARVTLTDKQLIVETIAKTPMFGLALYHQSSVDINEWLNVSAGLRVDYERQSIDYDSHAQMGFTMMMQGSDKPVSGFIPVEYIGSCSTDYLRVLPRLSVLFKLNEKGNVYATISKGQRSGGYNVQTFSDIVSASFRAKPGTTALTPDDVENTITYRPEDCWNYEVGAHLTPFDWLTADVALFYMDIADQQVAKFSEGGLGRSMVNAGKSKSYGTELSVQAQALNNRLLMNANYGYSCSEFASYETVVDGVSVDYSGNKVPFVPNQTLSVAAEGVLVDAPTKKIKRLSVGADCTMQGRIYWLEDNSAMQQSYAQIGVRANAQIGSVGLNVWAKNLTDTDFSTFYFESLGHRFAQRGKPMHMGLDFIYKF